MAARLCYTVFMDTGTVVINGKIFRFVKRSRRGDVAVYTSGDLYARVGEREVVEGMLDLHKKFNVFSFPVPEIVGQGEIAGQGYFLEKSLGEKCFSFLFQDDIEKSGGVSPELFEKFISIAEKFARAQLRSALSGKDSFSITALVRPEDLAEELPEFGGKILKLYGEALEKVKIFPNVLTHGDFCSHNLFPSGVIDFEEVYYAPAGYDIVTNIFHNKYFPAGRDYEYYRLYKISGEQESLYYRRLDSLYLAHGLPELSKYRKHFEYLRAIWLTRRNGGAPKLQAWRYELFKSEYLL